MQFVFATWLAAAPVSPAPAAAPVTSPEPATRPAPAPDSSASPAPPSRLVPKNEPARMAEAPMPGKVGSFKPGQGVGVASADGRFSINFNAFAQLQASLVHQAAPPFSSSDGAPLEPINDFTLQLRRARMVVFGNLFSPNIKYRIQLTFAPAELLFRDGVPHRSPILDWFFTFDKVRDATLVVGQYKVPYNHQRMLRVTGLQFVDRAQSNFEFTLDRDIGLDLRSRDIGGLGKLRYYLGVYMGDGISRYVPGDFGLMYLGRFEVLPFGQYDDLEESDLERSTKPRMLLGAAYSFVDRDPHVNHGFGSGTWADGGTASSHNATADINFRIAGFSLEGAFFYRQGWRQPGSAVDAMGDPIAPAFARNGLGFFAQTGYLIPRAPLELGVRFGQIYTSRRTPSSLVDSTEIGAVFSYFIARHSVKLQFDYFRLFSSVQLAPSDQVRLQLQAMF
jgi:phosphate-selective porin OprO/OprP